MSGKNNENTELWLPLDNAAKIFPAITNSENTSVFRISVILKSRVKIKFLFEAVQSLETRFPYYKVKLRRGFFWYYLERVNKPTKIIVDNDMPCRAFKKNDILFRILVRDKTISVEFSHIISDGGGAFQYLKSIVTEYLKLCELVTDSDLKYHKPNEEPKDEEFEDAYNRYFTRIKMRPPKRPKAFHVPFRVEKKPRLSVLSAIVQADAIVKKAQQYNVSITEYLTAVYAYSLQTIFENQSSLKKIFSKKIIRIEVPINLRRLFPSRTMRNFSLYVLPEIDTRLGHYSFDEIIKNVYHQMRLETDKKLISKMLSRNVSSEKNPFVRGVPLFIKSLILNRVQKTSTKQYSGVVTNMGQLSFGEKIDREIDNFLLVPPPPNTIIKANCAVAGFENKLTFTFCNVTVSKEFERIFFKFLASEGIPVKLIDPTNKENYDKNL